MILLPTSLWKLKQWEDSIHKLLLHLSNCQSCICYLLHDSFLTLAEEADPTVLKVWSAGLGSFLKTQSRICSCPSRCYNTNFPAVNFLCLKQLAFFICNLTLTDTSIKCQWNAGGKSNMVDRFSKEIKAYAQQMTDKEKILKWEIL